MFRVRHPPNRPVRRNLVGARVKRYQLPKWAFRLSRMLRRGKLRIG